ncbi:MAG: AsmA family protein, partial [Muribaculaceae bacterium]|nr:AsmA family protein [Muribaculaceae bacterium]
MKNPVLKRILRILAWAVGSLVALLILILCAVAWILTPERLTPLVEKYASEYLTADLKAERVELTVWKSFPYVELDAKGIHLTSRALQGQPDSVMKALPADAARLADAGSIHASINPWHLLRGVIRIGDVKAKGLGLNLVAYSPEVANYLITPPSEPSESKPMRFEFDNIDISAEGGMRYFDASAGLDLLLNRPMLTASQTDDNIKLAFSSPLSFTADGHKYLNAVPLGLSGNFLFKQDPMALSSKDMEITLWNLPVQLAFGLDLSDNPALTECNLTLPPLEVMPLLRMAAPELLADMPELKGLDTNLSFGLKANVKCPWRFDSKDLPDVQVSYEIPPCRVDYSSPSIPEKLSINPLTLSGTFTYTGANPSASVADIPVFTASGDGIDLSLTARVDEALSDDPLITLTSRGKTDISHFASLLPFSGAVLKGTVSADASVKCHLSDITEQRWQNLDANGRVEMRGLLFSLPVMATKFYAGLATITLGSDMDTHDTGRGLVQGMLRAQLSVDTAYCGVPGISVDLRDLDLKAGTTPAMLAENTSKQVMPMGLKLTAGRMKANSQVDTMHVLARNFTASGSITRYEGNTHSPLMKAQVTAQRLRYTDPYTRMGIRGVEADLQAHLRQRKSNAKRNTGANHSQAQQENVVDLSVNDGLKALIRKWGVEGGLRADRVNLTYISYPVRTRLTNLALDFNLDSLHLHRAYLSSQNHRMSR